jgi:hypothetical protein
VSLAFIVLVLVIRRRQARTAALGTPRYGSAISRCRALRCQRFLPRTFTKVPF